MSEEYAIMLYLTKAIEVFLSICGQVSELQGPTVCHNCMGAKLVSSLVFLHLFTSEYVPVAKVLNMDGNILVYVLGTVNCLSL